MSFNGNKHNLQNSAILHRRSQAKSNCTLACTRTLKIEHTSFWATTLRVQSILVPVDVKTDCEATHDGTERRQVTAIPLGKFIIVRAPIILPAVNLACTLGIDCSCSSSKITVPDLTKYKRFIGANGWIITSPAAYSKIYKNIRNQDNAFEEKDQNHHKLHSWNNLFFFF